jgi:hypothetical protein
VELDSSFLHEARRSLFSSGIRRGFVTVEEIEQALPPGSMSSAERWLLYYSLGAIGVEIRPGSELVESASETA